MKKKFLAVLAIAAVILSAISCASKKQERKFHGEFEKFKQIPLNARLAADGVPRIVRVDSLSAANEEIISNYYVCAGISKPVTERYDEGVVSVAEAVYREMAVKNGFPYVIYEATIAPAVINDKGIEERQATYQAYFYYSMQANERLSLVPGLSVSEKPGKDGVWVDRVYVPSPAADIGIVKDSVIVQINDEYINSYLDYKNAVGKIVDHAFVNVVYVTDNVPYNKSFVFRKNDMNIF